MTRELQFQFSKDGLKGKTALSKTQHYKLLSLYYYYHYYYYYDRIFTTTIIILKICLSHRSVLRSPHSAVICIEIDK